MAFNSCFFIFIFLPVTVVMYYLLGSKANGKAANYILLVASLVFYLICSWKHLLILLIEGVINYNCSKKFLASDNRNRSTGLLLTIAISINVCVLVFFKYIGIVSGRFLPILGDNDFFTKIVMPVGLSFFTFQQIAYLVDSYRIDGVDDHTFIEYLLFSFFFPCITSGPIAYYSELIPQFRSTDNKKVDYERICRGLYLFSLGLAKKVLIAQPFADAVYTGYDGRLPGYGVVNSVLMVLAYTFQIYFDFSGYSDMAIGIGQMFNITLPINFDSPYQAYNINEFWDRWHITLTRFLTKYIYIPLGGSRKGKLRTYINILIVFFISGIWHGATLAFVIWGMMHGFLTVLYRLFKKIYDKWHIAVQWIMTFGAVSIAWVYFGAPSKAEANTIISKLIGMNFDNIDIFFADCFNITEMDFIFELVSGRKLPDVIPNFMMIVFLLMSFFIVLCTENNMKIIRSDFEYKKIHAVITVVLITMSILSFGGVSTFIYVTF